MQLDHYHSPFKPKQFPVTIVCDSVTNAPNIGSLFRVADAFGVEKIIFCGKQISLGRKMTKTSRATEKNVMFEHHDCIQNVINDLKEKAYNILSLEITTTSLPVDSIIFSKHNPIALVVGDENFGVSDSVLKQSDAITHITMFGKNSSMNVVQATNIALYEITKQMSNT